MTATRTVLLHELAHARSGDKGDRLNVCVVARDPARFDWLLREVTVERVRAALADRRPGAIARYELPRLHAMNFVVDDVLDGGVNASLNLDGHGKSLSYRILAMRIAAPEGVAGGNEQG